jgi:hypothetical protein
MSDVSEINREFKNRHRLRSRPDGGAASTDSAGFRQSVHKGLAGVTADATTAVLSDLDGNAFVGVPDNHSVQVVVEVVAAQTGGAAGTVGDTASWLISGVVTRLAGAGTIVLPGVPVEVSNVGHLAAAAWTAELAVDTVNGGITVEVTGEADKDIKWSAKVSPQAIAFA